MKGGKREGGAGGGACIAKRQELLEISTFFWQGRCSFVRRSYLGKINKLVWPLLWKKGNIKRGVLMYLNGSVI